MAKMMMKQKMVIGMILLLVVGCCVPTYAAGAKAAPKLNKKKVSVKVGKTVTIKVLRVSKKTKVKWSVKNKKIASVKKGKITGKKSGTTKVYALVGKKKLSCKVTVVASGEKTTPDTKKTTAPIPTATPGTTVAPTAVPPAAVTPTPEPSDGPGNSEYDEAMVSGTEEAFNKYFNVDRSQYTKKQEGVTPGELKQVNYESSVVGTTREAYVYTPANYQEDGEYPVVYMLHGFGCDGTQWKSMNIARILDNMIARQEIRPIVAVLPSIVPVDDEQTFATFAEEFSTDLEPFIFDHYAVSRERKDTGICGLSMGGMVTLNLGFSKQDRFNYIAAFSSAPSLDTSLLQYAYDDMRPELVLLCTGTADEVVGGNPDGYHLELTKNNVKHIWYQYPGGGHSYEVWVNGAINFLTRAYAP